jgi:hypothetical protein
LNEKNIGWSIDQLVNLYKKDNPGWDYNKCLKEARKIYKELNRLNANERNNNIKYFNHNLPYSLIDNNNDSENTLDKTSQYKEYEKQLIRDKLNKLTIKDLDKNEVEEK